MILQSSNYIDYFLITVFSSPLIVFLIIKLTFHLFNRRHLNRGITRNLLHFVFSIIIVAVFFYIYDLYGTSLAEKYINNPSKYFTNNEVNNYNYKNFKWDRKLLSHDGRYVIDERLIFEKNGKIKLFIKDMITDNWFAFRSTFNLYEGQGYLIYKPIYDSLFACEERTLFSDTAYFFYNDSLKIIETDLHY